MNTVNPPVVAIVDGYSTGKYLAPFLHKRNYLAIHIQSSIEIPDFMLKAFRPDDFIAYFIFKNDIDDLLHQLQGYNILAVFAGTETAIYLTDLLASKLNLPGNSPDSSLLRRDKFAMVDAINRGGLAAAKQYKSSDLQAILQWHINELQQAWPLVIKPVNSAGTDSLRFCYNIEDIRSAVENILGRKNKLGIINQEVLVQSFLDGQEYVVNTVSAFGKHHLTDIRKCHKKIVKNAGFVSGCEELISAEDIALQTLKHYAFKALDALGVSHGPGHFEIMLSKKGPKIIEMGARIQGGIDPASNTACLGLQQIDKTIDAYLETDRFFAYQQQDYQLKAFGLWVFLIAEKEGLILSAPIIEKIKALPSFFSLQMNVKPGDYLQRTIDFYTSPGHVHLVSDSQEQLWTDFQTIRSLEPEGFMLKDYSTVTDLAKFLG